VRRAALAIVLISGASLAGCGATTKTSQDGVFRTVTGTPSSAPQVALGIPVAKMLSDFGETTVATQEYQTKNGIQLGSRDYCGDSNPCFGTAVTNKESGPDYLFEDAAELDGVIVGYYEDFPTNTTYGAALRKVLEYLPSDVREHPLAVIRSGGSCGLVSMTSHKLASELSTTRIEDPNGAIGVEFGYTGPQQQNQTFNPNNVQYAYVTVAPLTPEDGCYSVSAQLIPRQRHR